MHAECMAAVIAHAAAMVFGVVAITLPPLWDHVGLVGLSVSHFPISLLWDTASATRNARRQAGPSLLHGAGITIFGFTYDRRSLERGYRPRTCAFATGWTTFLSARVSRQSVVTIPNCRNHWKLSRERPHHRCPAVDSGPDTAEKGPGASGRGKEHRNGQADEQGFRSKPHQPHQQSELVFASQAQGEEELGK